MGIIAFHEENPGIRVEVSDVFRLLTNGAITHLFGTIKLLAFQTKVVGIVVEAHDIVLHIDERRVVSRKGLRLFPLLVINVAKHSEHVRHQTLRHELSPDAKSLLQNLGGIREFLLLGKCNTEVIGVGNLLGMVVETATANVLNALLIVLIFVVME